MLEVKLSRVTDFGELGEIWTAFQEQTKYSVFQSWTWIGCLAKERFPNPVLLEARASGALVAMGLFNLRPASLGRDTLWLSESGDVELDAPFIEQNGFLIGSEETPALLAECLNAARAAPIGAARPRRRRNLVLSGVGAQYLPAARSAPGIVRLIAIRPAPYVDLLGLRQSGQSYLASLSSNARYQLRRSRRRYEALGALTVRRAGSLVEANLFLDRLVILHQAYWRGRGRPGAFPNDGAMMFHRALIDRGFKCGAIDLLEVSAGQNIVGYLYNLKKRRQIYAYQSGFDYSVPHRHCKPGLTCHHLAIEMYLAEGDDVYDFLAGGDRYKRTLTIAATMLYWIAIHPIWSASGLAAAVKNLYGKLWRSQQSAAITRLGEQ